MAERIYYVLCGANCKYEGMTKEQIIAAIAEATGNTPQNIDSAFITKIKEINKGAAVKIWLGTTAEYNALETKDEDGVIYIKTDDSALEDLTRYFDAQIAELNETRPISKGGTGATTLLAAADTLGFASFSKATQLAAETDLDTVIEYGNYKCTSTSRVATLKNCPTANAFRMYVYSPAPDVAGYFAQDIYDLITGTRIYRYTHNNGGTWKTHIHTLDDSFVQDYITKTGINGKWTYRQWKSGLVEAWGRLEEEAKIVEVLADGEFPQIKIEATYPNIFDDLVFVNATLSSNLIPYGISSSVVENGKLYFWAYIVPDYLENVAVGDAFPLCCEIKGEKYN